MLELFARNPISFDGISSTRDFDRHFLAFEHIYSLEKPSTMKFYPLAIVPLAIVSEYSVFGINNYVTK